jgi:hypothetical protein
VCPAARKLDRITYEEMLEEASLGAKVLQIRSVEFAMKYRVPLWVRSSFTDDPGTLVCEEDAAMEDVLVSGITYDRNEARLVLRGVPDRPGVAARIFGALDERHIVVDIIVQTAQQDGRAVPGKVAVERAAVQDVELLTGQADRQGRDAPLQEAIQKGEVTFFAQRGERDGRGGAGRAQHAIGEVVAADHQEAVHAVEEGVDHARVVELRHEDGQAARLHHRLPVGGLDLRQVAAGEIGFVVGIDADNGEGINHR